MPPIVASTMWNRSPLVGVFPGLMFTGARVVIPVVVGVLATVTGRARGEPAKPPTFAQATAEAQRAFAAKDYRAAEQAYQAALKARPRDLHTREELAWMALLAGDFDRAEGVAIYAAYDEIEPRRRAMVYYNAGRAAEARGRPGDAMSAYAASLALRDNAEVRARLKSLSPGLAAHELAGPFVKPEDGCKRACEIEREESPHWDGGANIAAPFRAAVKLVDKDDSGVGYPMASIGLELDDGWYVLREIGEAVGGHAGTHAVGVTMSGARAVVDWRAEVGRFGHSDQHAIYACGIGKHGKPSCVGPIALEEGLFADHCAKDQDCTIPYTYGVWFHCRAELTGDVLEIGRDPSTIEVEDSRGEVTLPREDACDALPIFGKHALTF